MAGVATSTYPRPHFDRSHSWHSLDGEWDFAADPESVGYRQRWHLPGKLAWSQRILVPFPWESPRSGVHSQWLPVGWYHRTLARPAEWANARTILHFGAAHYLTTLWVNGLRVGEHAGGYLPFEFDITDWLQDGRGDVVIRVEAPVDKRYLPHGKQRSQPADDYDDCAFTASSGIWQPLWWESRPATYIKQIKLRPKVTLDAIEATITLEGEHLTNATLLLTVRGEKGDELHHQEPLRYEVAGRQQINVTLNIDAPQLWSPASPFLYFVSVILQSSDGEDRVISYTGLRTIEVQGDRLLLNGKGLYVRGALDQGFWPDTIYTAPDDDNALKHDVELALAAGYNLIRKHIKLENPRWLYWADWLGLLVWEEPPCLGRFTPAGLSDFESQLLPMIERDGNHPCIVIWGIYNEEWGLDWESHSDPVRQQAVERAYNLVKGADPTRPIVDDSGWWHVKTDLVDWHYYDMDMQGWCANTRSIASNQDAWSGISCPSANFPNVRLSVPGRSHSGKPLLNGEYGGGFPHNQGWIFRWQTADIRRYDAFCGYIYTELYDIEHEIVGIYTAQRQLKELGCHPAILNAETVIIFDHIPHKPGLDYLAPTGLVSLAVLVSHHGDERIDGELHWSWQPDDPPLGCAPLAVSPFRVSEPVTVEIALPEGQSRGKLHLRFLNSQGERVAYNFLDVAMVSS